jgi:hypothetical protein
MVVRALKVCLAVLLPVSTGHAGFRTCHLTSFGDAGGSVYLAGDGPDNGRQFACDNVTQKSQERAIQFLMTLH